MFTAISTLAHSIAPAAHRLKPLRVHVRTIIYDNSKEFAGHRQIARILHTQAFFATPYHAGEHGGTENANGLIRNDFSRSGKSRGIRHFKNNARK